MGGDGYALSQSVRMGQDQVLAPQVLQSLKLLQMTAPELRAELQHAMEQNPVIEDVTTSREVTLSAVAPDEHKDKSAADHDEELDFTPDGEAAERTLSADDGHLEYFMGNMESGGTDEAAATRRQRLFDLQAGTETLQEHLLKQIPLSDLDAKGRAVAEAIVGGVNDDGYFIGSFADIAMVEGVDEKRVVAVQARVLKFDPAGCGARTAQECLLAQMDKLDDDPWQNEVRRIVAHHLPDVAARRDATICGRLGITPDELKKALASLKLLDPWPGRAYASSQAARPQYVTPEVHVVKKNGRWTAFVDSRGLPDIRISPRYIAMLENPDTPQEVRAYIRERVNAAEALVEAVERRQDTIQSIAQAIVDAQTDFFERGPEALKPLTMQQVADKVGVHGTTVSRTVRDKYATTPFGTRVLRSFFTGGVATDSGDAVSTTSVQSRLKAIIEAENRSKPLSDEKIAAALKAEGIEIARRTVAKYREALGIPGAAARKEARQGWR